jgi:hypothetical protein
VAEGHLLFVWTPRGYELQERAGDPPSLGSEVEADGELLLVTKVGPPPLPGDERPCAYLQSER